MVYMCLDYKYYLCLFFFFFFQAEDGIRDIGVTGVQTCALPISSLCGLYFLSSQVLTLIFRDQAQGAMILKYSSLAIPFIILRSEERRVGKECRSRWSPYH